MCVSRPAVKCFSITESARVQYALVDRAVALGWGAGRVKAIDADLGMSGASAQGRPGFAELVSEVGLGHVGIVLGVEVSRLARSGRDWYQLMELCALAGTLLGDSNGIYDPAQYNDRLLLGLKGTMSEAELHLIKQRMAAGRLAKAQRGELFFSVPTGYVLRPSGEVVKDPDEQVQAVIRLIFELFDELGTINAVLAYLVEHRIQLGIRLREGVDQGELAWRRPNRMIIQHHRQETTRCTTMCACASTPIAAGRAVSSWRAHVWTRMSPTGCFR
ncbi:recombinase family protein [Nonomuraea sp. NBC_00507]|uniref:recombinase family protein n=1 Tax=Nonomuraea sp. NBC_00507 TaxID=2976002 RepID=UPI002E17146B